MSRPSLRPAARAAAALALALLAAGATGAWGAGVTIDDGPSGPTNDATPTFAFTAPGAATCALDGADPAPCTSPVTLGTLADGPHVFEVTAGGAADARSFRVDTIRPDVETDAGGVVTEPQPQVVFTAEGGAATTCAIDGADAEPCVSPWTTPPLRNGSRTLYIRATDAAGNTGEAVRVLQVQAAPPETRFTAGPDGDTESAAPEFGVAASRAGSRLQCWVDDAAPVACGATWRPAALTPGDHVAYARAVDAAGNADPTPAARAFTVTSCRASVTLGALEFAAPCLREEDGKLVATGRVRVNGISFNPRAKDGKGRLVIDPSTREVTFENVQMRMGSIVLFQGDLRFTVPADRRFTLARIDLETKSLIGGAPGDTEAALDLQGSDDAAIAGFRLRGSAQLDVADGGAELIANVELPDALTDAEGHGLTGRVVVRADDRGVRLGEAQVTAPLAFLGRVELHDVFVSFADDGDGVANPTCATPSPGLRWEGGASAIVLPTPNALRLTDVGVGFADGVLSYAAAGWTSPLPDGTELIAGVRLKRLGVSLCAGPPLTLTGRAALTAIPGADGKPRLTIPEAGLRFTSGETWNVRASADKAQLDGDVPIAFRDVFVQVASTGAVDFGGRAALKLDAKGSTAVGDLDAAVSIDAGLSGFIDGSRFNAEVDATGCFAGTLKVGGAVPLPFSDVCPKVSGVVSSTGVAVCGELKVDKHVLGSVGAGLRWGGPLQFMGQACDVGPWRVTRTASAASAAGFAARAATAAAALTPQPVGFAMPMARRGVLVALRGGDAAPAVTLRGPGGRRVVVTPDAHGAARGRGFVAFTNDATRTTYVALLRPRAGRWSAVAQPGARLVVARAAVLGAPARVHAHLAGHGRTRVLRVAAPRRAGQRVRLVERGRGVARTLAVLPGGTRAIRFTAADGPGGPRRVEAIVEQGGVPRTRLTVARFTAPPRLRPGRPPGVRVARSTRAVRVTWGAAPRAARYGVRVTVSDGRQIAFLRGAGARSVRLTGVPRGRRVSVRVVGLRGDNRPGRAAATSSPPSHRSTR